MVDVLAKQMETWDSILENIRTCSTNTNHDILFGELSRLVVSTRRIVDVALKWSGNQWELTTRRQILARQVDGDPIPPDTTPSTAGGISHYSWAFPVYLGHVVADRSEN